MRLLLGALRLFVYRALWHWLGITSAGRALVRALGSPDENIRSIAGILLTKSGKRAEPLLEEALVRREHLPIVLTVLGSIGDPALIPQLATLLDGGISWSGPRLTSPIGGST